MSDETQDDIILDSTVPQNKVIDELSPEDELRILYDRDLDEEEEEDWDGFEVKRDERR